MHNNIKQFREEEVGAVAQTQDILTSRRFGCRGIAKCNFIKELKWQHLYRLTLCFCVLSLKCCKVVLTDQFGELVSSEQI